MIGKTWQVCWRSAIMQRLPQQGATPAADPSALHKLRRRIWRREGKHGLVMLAGGSAAWGPASVGVRFADCCAHGREHKAVGEISWCVPCEVDPITPLLFVVSTSHPPGMSLNGNGGAARDRRNQTRINSPTNWYPAGFWVDVIFFILLLLPIYGF